MTNLNDSKTNLSSEDLKEAFLAVRSRMVQAIEDPSKVKKSSDYYHQLSQKLHKIWFSQNAKEKGYDI